MARLFPIEQIANSLDATIRSKLLAILWLDPLVKNLHHMIDF